MRLSCQEIDNFLTGGLLYGIIKNILNTEDLLWIHIERT